MKGGRDGCAVNPATKRCSKKGTKSQQICKLSNKNRCMKVKCGVNPATKRCSMTGTKNRKSCEISEKNRCRKKKVQRRVRRVRRVRSPQTPRNASVNQDTKINNKTVCRKYKDLKKIDLNDIKVENISSIQEQKLRKECFKEYKLLLPVQLSGSPVPEKYLSYHEKSTGKKHILCDVKYISRGSYGEVSVHSDSSKKYRIALKTYRNPRDSEFAIIKLLEKKKVNCNLINARIIPDLQDSRKITIMNFMDGSLKSLRGNVSTKNIKQIIKKIAQSLLCLKKKKLSYTDLKADNVLFKCYKKSEIDVKLGDLGSICKEGKTNATTWSPYEFRKNIYNTKCNETTMVWCLGVTLLELIGYSKLNMSVSDLFYWNNIKKLTTKRKEDEFKKNLDVMIKKVDSKFPILKSMLETDKKKRATLQQVIDNI